MQKSILNYLKQQNKAHLKVAAYESKIYLIERIEMCVIFAHCDTGHHVARVRSCLYYNEGVCCTFVLRVDASKVSKL